jgi:hypothetical protein
MLLAVLGLASISVSGQSPIPPFWVGTFLLKPNHGTALGVAALAFGLRARRAQWWSLGIVLGLLGWVFIVAYGYVIATLWMAALISPRAERDWRRLAFATLLSLLICAPEILNLARDYSPIQAGAPPEKSAYLTRILSVPHWVTLDLGLLLLLGIGGALLLRRRGLPRDRILLGALCAAATIWLIQAVTAHFGIGPEPDELHYYVRFTMALSAGAALAAVARFLEQHWRLLPGRGHVLTMAVCLPLTFTAYWDPPTMDRYFQLSSKPIPRKVLSYASWIRDNTPPEAVFLAGPFASSWIPALTGRRVLLTGHARPPADYELRKQVETLLMLGTNLDRMRQFADAYGVTHVAVDPPMMKEYGFTWFKRPDVYETLYRSSAIKIMRLR